MTETAPSTSEIRRPGGSRVSRHSPLSAEIKQKERLAGTPGEGESKSGRRGFLRRAAAALPVAIGMVVAGFRPDSAFGNDTARPRAGGKSYSGAEDWLGQIVTVPYNFAPRGFVFCEGQELQIRDNQSLYALIGNFYGGDGRTTFKLPDTRPLEAAAKKQVRAQRPPFRYAIALAGTFPSRA